MSEPQKTPDPVLAQSAGYATAWNRPMCGECPLFYIRESDLNAGDLFAWCRLYRDRRHHECPACPEMDAHLSEVRRMRCVVSDCDAQHTADAESIRVLRNALRDASEEPNIDRARAIADEVLCGKSHNRGISSSAVKHSAEAVEPPK